MSFKYIVFSHTYTNTRAHKHKYTITQGKGLVVSLALWHISCHESFGEKGVIKENNHKIPKINHLLHEDDVKRQEHVSKKNKLLKNK